MPQEWDEKGNPVAPSSGAEWDEHGNAISKPGAFENAMNHAGAKIAQIPGALADTVMHPIDTIASMYGQQKQLASEGVDAAKRGDYPLAAARGMETLMPGIGPNIAEGFKTINSGDVSGGIGDMVGGTGPALVLKAGSLSPKVRAFTREAVKETGPTIAENLHIPRNLTDLMTKNIPIPTAIGTMAGHYAGHPVIGGAVGAVGGALPSIIRAGARAAKSEPWFPGAGASIPPISPGLLRLGASPMEMSGSVVADESGPIYNPRNNPMSRNVRALPSGPSRIIDMPGAVDAMEPDTSGPIYNPRNSPMTVEGLRRLPPASAIQMPGISEAPPMASTVEQSLPGGRAISDTPAAEPLPNPKPDYSGITKQYQPSRTRARFDKSGKRTGG